MAPDLGHSRACNLADFSQPELARVIREVFPHEIRRFGAGFPSGREYRKHWEVAMAVRALRAAGAVHDRAEALGVAAGDEPTLFWLSRWVRRVFATDRYLDAGVWAEFADPTMLTDPGAHWPGTWDPRRLVVQHMDALDLRYADGSFDAVFSSSSIEHFGGLTEVRRAMAEMHRVLRPGGVLSLSTELRLEGPPPGLPGTLLLDEREILEHVIEPLGWEPVGPLRLDVDEMTRRSAVPLDEHLGDIRAHFAREGRWVLHRLRFSRYPQVALRAGEHLWTSVHLALRKARGRGRRPGREPGGG